MAKAQLSMDYVGNLEKSVTKRLLVSRTWLLVCKPHDRAQLKQEIETLSNVLYELQGKRKKGRSYMNEGILTLRERLQEAEDKLMDSINNLSDCQQTIEDNKRHICQTENLIALADRIILDLRRELMEVQVNSLSRLSLEAAINQDLRSKLDTKTQLQQSLHSIEATPEMITEILLQKLDSAEQLQRLGSEGGAAAEEAGRSVDALELELDLPNEEDTKGEEEQVVCLKIGQLRECYQIVATELWRERDNELMKQNVENNNLRAALKQAEEQLELHRQSVQIQADECQETQGTTQKEVQRPGLMDRIRTFFRRSPT